MEGGFGANLEAEGQLGKVMETISLNDGRDVGGDANRA